MACMLFLQSPQKHNQRTFTSTYRRHSVLLNTIRKKKKSSSKKKISKKQLVEESYNDDKVISNVGALTIYQSLMVKYGLEALMIISGMLFILLLELISILFLQKKLLSCFINEFATFRSLTQYP